MCELPYSYILWTDGSFKKYDGNHYCGYGYIILNTRTMKFATFGEYIGGITIARGELLAIYKAIDKTLKFIGKNTKAKILVVTDSKLAVNGFSLQIPYTWNLSNWDNWKTKKGTSVKNQEIYRRTLELIRKYPKVKIRIAHMHGHVTRNNLDKTYNDLLRHGINADDATVNLFRNMNAEVDKIARSKVEEQIKMDKKQSKSSRCKTIPQRVSNNI